MRVEYSPFADPGIINSLLDFHLGCLTSFRVCREPAELMPTAWRMRKDPAETDSSGEREPTDEEEIEGAGRDSEYAAIAEITGTSVTTEDGKRLKWATLRLIQSLKNGAPAGLEVHGWQPLGRAEETVRKSGVAGGLKKGDRLIALFEIRQDRPELDSIWNGYGLVPYTDRNLAAVKRGIARDKLADVP
jgi:hypothetical protein